jgi:hypothetical protein
MGVEGIVVEFEGKNKWTSDCERYWQVRFPEAGVWDILPNGLEILDKDYVEWREAEREADKRDRELKLMRQIQEGTIHDVVFYQGPRGKFKGLIWPGGSSADKEEAAGLMALFKQHNIPVSKQVI